MLLVILGTIISFFSAAYTLLLLGRVVLDWTRFFAPNWKPEGFLLVIANWVYAVTDPPLRWLRRFIPPLRLGAVALDVGFIVLFVAVSVLGRFGAFLISWGYQMT